MTINKISTNVNLLDINKEPSDQSLNELMIDVINVANDKHKIAHKSLFDQITLDIQKPRSDNTSQKSNFGIR